MSNVISLRAFEKTGKIISPEDYNEEDERFVDDGFIFYNNANAELMIDFLFPNIE